MTRCWLVVGEGGLLRFPFPRPIRGPRRPWEIYPTYVCVTEQCNAEMPCHIAQLRYLRVE